MPRTGSSLARLQQAVAVLQAAAAAATVATLWPLHPVWALVGGVAVAGSHALILGLEFILLAGVARADAVPLAPARVLLRAWVAETLQAWRVFLWRQPFRWRVATDVPGLGIDPGRCGVVLVHGFVCNRGFWTPWLERLRADGRPVVAVNLEPVFGSIDAYVGALEAAVEQVRGGTDRPVVLVCHSMGGLVARAWWPRASGRVARVVTLGSPHAGTWLARFSMAPNARQMRQGSAWLAALAAAWTPEAARHFICWYSDADNIVMPPSTAMLAGADNRLASGAAHVDLAFQPAVMEATLALVRALDAPHGPVADHSPGANSGKARRRS